MSKRIILAAQWLWLAIVAALSVGLLGLADGGAATAALAVAYHVPRWFYARSRLATLAGHALLTGIALWLAVLALGFLWHSTAAEGRSMQWPHLDGDMANYYQWAVYHYSGQMPKPKITFGGYPATFLPLWWLMGQSLLWPVAMNVMLTLVALLLTSRMSVALLGTGVAAQERRVATWTIGLTGVLAFWLSQGTTLLKEPWTYVAVTLVGWALALAMRGGSRRRSLWLFAAGALILAVVRAKYVNFLPIAIVLLMAADYRRHWRLAALWAVAVALCWALGLVLADYYSVGQQANNVVGNEVMARAFEAHGLRGEFVARYYAAPWWQRVLVLPFTTALQTVIPLPVPPREQWCEITSWLPRIQWGWYAVVVLAVFFYLRRWRGSSRVVKCWTLFAPACIVAVAYMTAGMVSRYVLSFEPLIAVAAVAWITRPPKTPS